MACLTLSEFVSQLSKLFSWHFKPFSWLFNVRKLPFQLLMGLLLPAMHDSYYMLLAAMEPWFDEVFSLIPIYFNYFLFLIFYCSHCLVQETLSLRQGPFRSYVLQDLSWLSQPRRLPCRARCTSWGSSWTLTAGVWMRQVRSEGALSKSPIYYCSSWLHLSYVGIYLNFYCRIYNQVTSLRDKK